MVFVMGALHRANVAVTVTGLSATTLGGLLGHLILLEMINLVA